MSIVRFAGIAARSAALPAVLAAGVPAAAQQPPLVTDRPDFTESAVAVPRPQLESGYTHTRTGGAREHALGEVLVRLPLMTGLELRLGLNSHLWTRSAGGVEEAGFEDASVGAKLVLADGSEAFDLARPAVALIASTTVPTGAAPFRESGLQPEAKLALAWPLADRAGLSANLNYAYPRDAGERFHQFSGSASLGYALTERLGSYVELYGFTAEAKGAPSVVFANGGVTYGLTSDLQLDARVGTELNGGERLHFGGLGFAWRW